MSGGQIATRGFLLQTLVLLLGAFAKGEKDKTWIAVEIEPDTINDVGVGETQSLARNKPFTSFLDSAESYLKRLIIELNSVQIGL